MKRLGSLCVVVSGVSLFLAGVGVPAHAAQAPPAGVGEPADVWEPEPVDVVSPQVGSPPEVEWSPEVTDPDAGSSRGRLRAPSARAFSTVSQAPVGVGDRGSDTFVEFALSADAGIETWKVNVGSGNVFMRSRLMELPGVGVPASVYRAYNSLTASAAGSGDASFLDIDMVGLATDPVTGQKVLYDGTGARWAFSGSGYSWSAAPGLRAELIKKSDGTWTVEYIDTGERIDFNSNGWVIKRTDRNGVGMTYSWGSSLAHPVAITDARGVQLTLNYDANDQLESVSAAGRTTSLTRGTGADARVISADYGAGRTATYTFSGERVTSVSYAGKTLSFTYDLSGRATQVTLSRAGEADRVTSFSYPSATQTVVTDAKGGKTTYTLDGEKRVTTVVDQVGRTASRTYDPKSNVATTTSSFSTTATTRTTYDEQNNATSITTPTGAATSAMYAAGVGCATSQTGNPHLPKCVTDAQGNTSAFEYDESGNLLAARRGGPTGAATFTYTYEGTNGVTCGGEEGTEMLGHGRQQQRHPFLLHQRSTDHDHPASTLGRDEDDLRQRGPARVGAGRQRDTDDLCV